MLFAIRVLKSFDEVGEAMFWLRERDYPLHNEPPKNWDMMQIAQILEEVKPASVLDMGCGGLRVLRLCHRMGIKNSYGIDLQLSLLERLAPFKLMLDNRSFQLPFKVLKDDLTKTRFKDKSFDVITCLSVIEHGVDTEAFLKEASRLLRKNGVLYVSTDYWEPKIHVNKSIRIFGLSWKIFSKKEIISLINLAEEFDLKLENSEIPPTGKKVQVWSGNYFTYISCAFKKIS